MKKAKLSGQLLKTSHDLESALTEFEKTSKEIQCSDIHGSVDSPDQEISQLRAALDKIKQQMDQFSES